MAGQATAFVGALEPLQPGAQVRIAGATAGQHVAFRQQGGQVCGERAMSQLAALQQQVRQAWVDTQRGHGATVRGNTTVIADSAQPAEHLTCLREPCRWRWVQHGQGASVLHAPTG